MKKRLLIVEDDFITAMLEEKLLEKCGYEISHVNTGEKAVDLICSSDESVDLILMDIDLGDGIDGTIAAQMILEYKDIPVVFLSSHTEPEVVEKTEKITSYGYVVKQSGIVVLDASIKMAFKLHEAKQRELERELALQQSEEKVRAILNASPSAIVLIDKDGIVLDCNNAYPKRFGQTYNELKGQCIWDLFPRDIREGRKEQVMSVFASGKLFRGIDEREGVWNEYSIEPAIVNNGIVEAVVVEALDITDKKRAEIDLLKEEERNRLLLSVVEQSDDIIVVKDLDLKVIATNMPFVRASGRNSVDDLIGKTDAEIFGISADSEPVKTYMEDERKAQSLKPGEYILREEPVITAEGERRYVRTKKYPIFDKEGRLIGTGNISPDITEIKGAEEALRQSEAAVRKKLKALTEPSGTFDDLELSDIIDSESLQCLLEEFYSVTGMGSAIVDIKGNVLVGAGWQDICAKFHRVHPDSERHCRESDMELASGIKPGEFKMYKCKNNMWDMASPIIVGESHLGNIYLGQFFYEDEDVDVDIFRKQAKCYGFDEDDYIRALERVPRFNRELVHNAMRLYSRLAGIISQLSYSNLQLSRAVSEYTNADRNLAISLEGAYADLWEMDFRIGSCTYGEWWANKLGYKMGEIPPTIEGVQGIIHPEDIPGNLKALETYMNGKAELYDTECRLQRKDGTWLWVLSRGKAVEWEDGKPVKLVGVNIDFSRFKDV